MLGELLDYLGFGKGEVSRLELNRTSVPIHQLGQSPERVEEEEPRDRLRGGPSVGADGGDRRTTRGDAEFQVGARKLAFLDPEGGQAVDVHASERRAQRWPLCEV